MKRNEAEMRIADQIESTDPKEVDFDKENKKAESPVISKLSANFLASAR